MNGREFTRHVRRGERQAYGLERQLAAKYEQVLLKAYRDAARNYVRASQVVAAAAGPTVDEVLNARAVEESAKARTRSVLRRMAGMVAAVALDAGGATKRRVLPLLANVVDRQAGLQAERLVAGVQQEIASVILSSIESGWTVPETAAAITDVMGERARWESTMLARTDLIGVSNGSSLAAAQALEDEAPGFKTWQATYDDRTRPSHADADGQTVPLDQPFDVGGEQLMFPGDPDGSDEECINCRCTVIYADTPDISRAHSDDGGIEEISASAATVEIMPWHVEQRDNQWCVVKDTDGAVEACHETRDEALAHQRALYVNVSDDEIAAAAVDDEEELIAMGTMTAAQFTQTQREKLAESGVAMDDGSYPIRNRSDLANAIQAFGRARNPEAVKRHIVKRARALGETDMLPEDWNVTAAGDMEDEPVCGACGEKLTGGGRYCTACGAPIESVSAAAAGPQVPPRDWFDDPGLAELTPLTVTDDGRVFGHIASWHQCHTGIQGRCVTPPRGLSYDYFNVGVLETDDGPVKVGKITAGTGHAPLTASRQETAAFYDNTGTVVAYVHAGEDEFGPWVAGTVKSDATPEQIRDLMANGPSGDWRAVRASGRQTLELVGVLAVPVQGFPIARASLAASGDGSEYVETLTMPFQPPDMDETVFARKLRVLHARALGASALAELAAGPLDPVSVRQRFTRAVPAAVPMPETQVSEGEIEVKPTNINITINLGEGADSDEALMLSDAQERELGLQVDYMRDHGHFSEEQLAGAVLDTEGFAQVLEAASEIIEEPESARSQLLVERMHRAGYLTSSAGQPGPFALLRAAG